MSKVKRDVVNAAYRRLGILGDDEALTAEQIDYAGDVLTAIFNELQDAQGLTIAWTLSTIPDELHINLAHLLAVDIAPSYEIAPRESRGRALARVRADLAQDDRTDFRDLDEDGTVSTAEAAAGERAQYY